MAMLDVDGMRICFMMMDGRIEKLMHTQLMRKWVRGFSSRYSYMIEGVRRSGKIRLAFRNMYVRISPLFWAHFIRV